MIYLCGGSDLSADFLHFGASDFPSKILFFASKSSFFRSGVEIRFWSYNFRRHCAYFSCVLQLSFRRSHWNGCVKVASCFGCMRNAFCSWISSRLTAEGWLCVVMNRIRVYLFSLANCRMPLSLAFGLCVRSYEPHKQP